MNEHWRDLNVSIIVPIHSGGLTLEKCLKSLENNSRDVFEIILVLDGVSLDEGFFDQFDLVGHKVERLQHNSGPAHARNHGANRANGDILFFLDSDVELLSDTLTKVSQHFEKNTNSCALIGSYDDDPYVKSLVSRYRNLLHHHTHQVAEENATTFWGACGAIKREVFLAIGGFDTSFSKPSVEDIELGYRLKQKNYTIKLEKDLQVKHLKKWTFLNTVKTDIFYRAKPWTKLLHRYQKLGVNDLNISHDERLAVAFLTAAFTSLIMSIKFDFSLPIGLISILSLLLIKRKTYRFFAIHFEWYKMPVVVLLHWVYLTCALLGFILGTTDRLFLPKEKDKPEIDQISNERTTEENLALNE